MEIEKCGYVCLYFHHLSFSHTVFSKLTNAQFVLVYPYKHSIALTLHNHHTQGSRNIRKSAKVVTMSLAFGGRGGRVSVDFSSLAFGSKFSHKLDHFWPNIPFYFRNVYTVGTHTHTLFYFLIQFRVIG